MNKNIVFERLRFLLQAYGQLQDLKRLKCQLSYKEVSEFLHEQELSLIERSNDLISLYQQIICFYPSQLMGKNDGSPNRMAYFRQRQSIKPQTYQLDDIKNIIIHSTLSCTIAYIHINMLSNLQEGSLILLRVRSQLIQLLGKLSCEECIASRSATKAQLKKPEEKEGRYDRDIEQSSCDDISRFCQRQSDSTLGNIRQVLNQVELSYVRVSMNLVISLILENRHPFAVEVFNETTKYISSIQVSEVKSRLISFIYECWFNIPRDGLITWKEEILDLRNSQQLIDEGKLSLEKAFTLVHLIFNSDLFIQQLSDSDTYPRHFVQTLQKCIAIFTENKLYEHSFFTLRHLIQSPLSQQLKSNYYVQLSQILQNQCLHPNLILQNIQSVQTFKSILSSLNSLQQNLLFRQRSASINEPKIDLFRLVIKLQISKVEAQTYIDRNEKVFIVKKLQSMQNETNTQIISSMLNQKLSQHLIGQISGKINKIFQFTHKKIQTNYKTFISDFKSYQCQKYQFSELIEKSINTFDRTQNKFQLKLRTVSPCHSRKYLKVISTAILTQTSIIQNQNDQKRSISESNLIKISNTQKKISKMVRCCEHGAFLNKRNFNTDSGQFKFIKITQDTIKWSKNPQKIDQSSHSYPLKDIKGIIYGKIAPNWKKPCNNNLKEELCFSLILQKRTMDFCCKNYRQVQIWVCGISHILKRHNPQIVGYSPGKMRWKKMFANLKEAFIQPLKLYERNNFYFENAYSLILFKKNQYKLPSHPRIL